MSTTITGTTLPPFLDNNMISFIVKRYLYTERNRQLLEAGNLPTLGTSIDLLS